MKVTQILKHRGRKLYTLGLKLIFIYAEYSGPTLFASLMNLCITKFLESLDRIKGTYNWHGRTALFYLKLPVLAKLLPQMPFFVELFQGKTGVYNSEHNHI